MTAPRRRKVDQAFHTRLWHAIKEQPIISLLLLAVLLQAVMLGLGLFVLNPRAGKNEKRIEALAHANTRAQLDTCVRGNVTRPETIRVYLGIAQGNEARAAAWREIAVAFPPTAMVVQDQIAANEAEAGVLEALAIRLSDAQQQVARFPDAEGLARRAIVDCQLAVRGNSD